MKEQEKNHSEVRETSFGAEHPVLDEYKEKRLETERLLIDHCIVKDDFLAIDISDGSLSHIHWGSTRQNRKS
jgi:hypothetical protein